VKEVKAGRRPKTLMKVLIQLRDTSGGISPASDGLDAGALAGCRKGLVEVADVAADEPTNGFVLASMLGDWGGDSNAAAAAAEAGANRRSLGADVLL